MTYIVAESSVFDTYGNYDIILENLATSLGGKILGAIRSAHYLPGNSRERARAGPFARTVGQVSEKGGPLSPCKAELPAGHVAECLGLRRRHQAHTNSAFILLQPD